MAYDYIQIISTVGFPIAVCLWFMFCNHKDMQKLTQVIENNTIALKMLKRK